MHSSGQETRYNSSFSKQQESRQKNWEKVNLYLFKTTYWVSKIKLCWLFFQIKRVDQKNSDSLSVTKVLSWYGIVVGNFLSTYYLWFWIIIRVKQVALFFNVDNMSNETKIWLPCKVSRRMLEGFEKEDFQKHQQNKG